MLLAFSESEFERLTRWLLHIHLEGGAKSEKAKVGRF